MSAKQHQKIEEWFVCMICLLLGQHSAAFLEDCSDNNRDRSM